MTTVEKQEWYTIKCRKCSWMFATENFSCGKRRRNLLIRFTCKSQLTLISYTINTFKTEQYGQRHLPSYKTSGTSCRVLICNNLTAALYKQPFNFLFQNYHGYVR